MAATESENQPVWSRVKIVCQIGREAAARETPGHCVKISQWVGFHDEMMSLTVEDLSSGKEREVFTLSRSLNLIPVLLLKLYNVA